MNDTLAHDIVGALRMVYDPELPVNIYDLGLIYDIDITSIQEQETVSGYAVWVKMTLTTPGCPAAEVLPRQVQEAVQSVEGVLETQVELVWDPPWTQARMSEAVKLQLGLL